MSSRTYATQFSFSLTLYLCHFLSMQYRYIFSHVGISCKACNQIALWIEIFKCMLWWFTLITSYFMLNNMDVLIGHYIVHNEITMHEFLIKTLYVKVTCVISIDKAHNFFFSSKLNTWCYKKRITYPSVLL